MILRWTFITSSYSSTFFLDWKLRPSTVFCAFSIAPERILASMGVSSSMPSVSIMFIMRSEPNRRMISSCMDR